MIGAVHVDSGLFVWCPWRKFVPGPVHDSLLCEYTGYESQMQPGEFGMGDKGYEGHRRILHPFKGAEELLSPSQLAWNRSLHTVRPLVERTFGRLKEFKALSDVWKHALKMHPFVFAVGAHSTNLKIKLHPL